MENERTRIVDIADELGLSTATVSNVIHGKTTTEQEIFERFPAPFFSGIPERG